MPTQSMGKSNYGRKGASRSRSISRSITRSRPAKSGRKAVSGNRKLRGGRASNLRGRTAGRKSATGYGKTRRRFA